MPSSTSNQTSDTPARIWTVGHSVRSLNSFIAVLTHHHIEAVVDMRRNPVSQQHPWLSGQRMEPAMANAGIKYLWVPALGGQRTPVPGSPNGGWRSESFQGYADHMASEEFAEGLEQVLQLAERSNTALMGAELLWWRCPRRLVADLLSLCMDVRHILDMTEPERHTIHPMARVQDGRLIYPPGKSGPSGQARPGKNGQTTDA